MVAYSSGDTIHFPFWHQGHSKNLASNSPPLSTWIWAQKQISRGRLAVGASARCLALSAQFQWCAPLHTALAGDITPLSPTVLPDCRLLYSVLLFHTSDPTRSVFQKLLTVFSELLLHQHRPAVFYLSISSTGASRSIPILLGGKGRKDMVVRSHVLSVHDSCLA